MILIIDNYDSFVYNLARYVELCKESVTVIRNDAISLAAIAALKPDKIIISPGPGIPDGAGVSLEVVRSFYTTIPILGVCLGHQIIAQVFGANIVRARHPLHGMSSLILHEGAGILASLPNPLQAGRYHSLIVEDVLPENDLFVTARSMEGEIMALQHKHYPVYGLQFHPESILTEYGMAILHNFL